MLMIDHVPKELTEQRHFKLITLLQYNLYYFISMIYDTILQAVQYHF